MKKIVLFLFFIIILSSFVLGDTPISDCQGLYNIRNSPSENYYLIQDIDCSSFGNFGMISSFSGNLDGWGHIVNGIYIERASTDDETALFKTLETGASITRIGLENIYVKSGSVGSIVYYNYGIISESFTTGFVESGVGWDAAGFVSVNYGTIRDSYAKTNANGGETGGFVNYNYGSIRNSYSTGNRLALELLIFKVIRMKVMLLKKCY